MVIITSIKALFRAWWRTLLLLLLCAVGVALPALGVGLYTNNGNVMEAVSKRFTTIAVLNLHELAAELSDETGYIDITDVDNALEKLIAAVNSVDCASYNKKKLYGAYIPGISALTTDDAVLSYNDDLPDPYFLPDGSMVSKAMLSQSAFDSCYHRGAFIVRCDALRAGTDSSDLNFYLSVEDVVALNDAISIPPMLENLCSFIGGSDLSEIPPEQLIPMEVGKRYLIIAQIVPPLKSNQEFSKICILRQAVYDEATRKRLGYDYFCYELSGSLDEALNGENGSRIRQLIDYCGVLKHSIDVIATESVQSIPGFNKGQLYITKGRDFLPGETEERKKVCLVGETFAAHNGISLGDDISMQLFDTSVIYMSHGSLSNWNRFTPELSIDLQSTSKYTVIGFFNTPDWYPVNPYTQNEPILPVNTVIVPYFESEMSLHSFEYPLSFVSIVIENGKDKTFLAEMEEVLPGSAKYFIIYDQGFSEVLPVVETFVKNAKSLGIMSVGVWGLTAALFVLIMVLVNRRDVGIMLSLGSGRRKAFCALFTRYFIIAVLGSALGGLAAYLLFDRALAYLGEFSAGMISSGTSFSFTGDPINTVYCALAALGALTVVSLASAALSARANARELLRDK